MLPYTWYPCVPFVFQGVSNFCSDTLFKLQNITLVIKGVYYCGATRAIASNVPRSRFPVIIINNLYFKNFMASFYFIESRQFGRIQWDSLKNKNLWNIHIQTTPLNSQARQRGGRRDWNISREAGAPNHGYLLNTGGPNSLHERGRDSCLRAVLCYKRLVTKACMESIGFS